MGLWLDSLMGQRGPATLCLLVLSIPISLWLMTKITLMMLQFIQPAQNPATKHIE